MKVFLKKKGLGDIVMASLWTSILRDNGIDAYFDHPNADMFNIPSSGDSEKEYQFDYIPRYQGKSIFQQNVESYREQFNKVVYITRNKPDVKIEETSEIYDVVLNFKSSKYSIFRDWPYKSSFIKLLKERSLKYLDLDDNVHSPKTLGIIKNAKSYVAIDSGLAHYAAQFSYKGLIVNSGRSYIDFWSIYNYHFLHKDISCMNCFLVGKSLSKCPKNQKCMTDISPKSVLEETLKIINRNSYES